MIRKLHKFPTLIAGLLVVVLATSGAVLSVIPALERISVPQAVGSHMSVADLAANVSRTHTGIDQIVRAPSGKIIVRYFSNDASGADIVDPNTGLKAANYQESGFVRWMTDLHRALFLDYTGRGVAGFGAVAMLILCYSGLALTARRMGGWRKLFTSARGCGLSRLHVIVGRLAVVGLALSSLTAMYLTLVVFGFLPNASDTTPMFPAQVNGGTAISPALMPALQNIPVTDLRELTFPYMGDPTDVFTIVTANGAGFIDQATGELLAWQPNGTAGRIYETIFMLHTGQGLWWLGLVLGLAALSVPFMFGTGIVMWWRTYRASPKIRNNAAIQTADTIILVGSESNSTWGFAETLHTALTEKGLKVHTGPMNQPPRTGAKAKRMFVLSATYGDGVAPASARSFLQKLEHLAPMPDCPVAVLGFGDQKFNHFCGFAGTVNAAFDRLGWEQFVPMDRIDRQSVQEFNRWGRTIGAALNIELDLNHIPERPRTMSLDLLEREDFGDLVQAPTTIFRFIVPQSATGGFWPRLLRGLPKFSPGDLVGILPPNCDAARYYSLASSSKDGVLEICVRKQPGGLCSTYLHGLQPGDQIDAFIKPNPDFRPAKGRVPVILVGAGTGVAPLAGFIRANRSARPMHLYFGGRDPASDFLYETEMAGWLQDDRLQSVNLAFSRVTGGGYVQNRIAADAADLRDLISQGAQIMVCGGREMARGVRTAMDTVLAPVEVSVEGLKSQGRYLEDVY